MFLMLTTEKLFLVFEQIISGTEYDCSIHSIMVSTPITIQTMSQISPQSISGWEAFPRNKWNKVFKSELSKFWGRQPLKNVLSPLLNTLSQVFTKAVSRNYGQTSSKKNLWRSQSLEKLYHLCNFSSKVPLFTPLFQRSLFSKQMDVFIYKTKEISERNFLLY